MNYLRMLREEKNATFVLMEALKVKIIESLSCKGFILWRAGLNMISLLIMFNHAEVETASHCSVSLSPVCPHPVLRADVSRAGPAWRLFWFRSSCSGCSTDAAGRDDLTVSTSATSCANVALAATLSSWGAVMVTSAANLQIWTTSAAACRSWCWLVQPLCLEPSELVVWQ